MNMDKEELKELFKKSLNTDQLQKNSTCSLKINKGKYTKTAEKMYEKIQKYRKETYILQEARVESYNL